MVLPRQAESYLLSFTLPYCYFWAQTDRKAHKLTQKPKVLSPSRWAHPPHGSVLLMLTWTKQVSDDTHHVSFFKGCHRRTNRSSFWDTPLMQGNAAEEKRSGSLWKLLLLRELEIAKSGADKPAKPLSRYFRKVSIYVYGWWMGKESKQTSFFSVMGLKNIMLQIRCWATRSVPTVL